MQNAALHRFAEFCTLLRCYPADSSAEAHISKTHLRKASVGEGGDSALQNDRFGNHFVRSLYLSLGKRTIPGILLSKNKSSAMKKAQNILANTVISGALALQGTLANAQGTSHADKSLTETIRPFKVNVSKGDLKDLRNRILATRWPEKETVADQSQGVQLAKLQELVHYWGTDYNWRKAEKKLNSYPQFKTMIDGVDIHFIHVKSKHPNALPIIITHGWPGSVFEQIKLIDPLTDPTKYGGRAEDAFDVVIPSLPGFGFSSQPTEAGWGLERIGLAWDVLMKRLGYTKYVAQGGDWGAGAF
jgi:hypothetical protein